MYLDHFQIIIIYGENMEGYENLHDFQILAIYGKKVIKLSLNKSISCCTISRF